MANTGAALRRVPIGDDSGFPIADMYLLLEHGSPKTARFCSGGLWAAAMRRRRSFSWLKEKLR